MKPEDITAKIRVTIPDAEVSLKDLTGTQDHWEAAITSDAFIGKSLIERHRLVNHALREELKGPIHALTLTLKTRTEAGSE
jgi:stress-induced morphogen